MVKFFEMPDRRRNTQITWRRSGSENIHLDPGQPRPRMKQENVSGESGGSSPPVQDSLQDDGEARNDFWSISGNYIYRITLNRIKRNVPREESFSIPLRYIDVTRATSTTLDVMLERRVDDPRLIRLMDWIHSNHHIGRKPADGYTWSGERLTKKQTTSRPDYLWPEIWKDMSEAAQRKEKQKWCVEKPKLDNARKLRGFYFIDPADAESKETIEKCAEKVGSSDPSSFALQDEEKKVQRNLSHS